MPKKKQSEPEKILNSLEIANVFYWIVGREKNYAQSISKEMGTTPENTLSYLKRLSKAGLIVSRKEKMLNKTVYEINLDKFASLFTKVLNDDLIINAEKFNEKDFAELMRVRFLHQSMFLLASNLINSNLNLRQYIRGIANTYGDLNEGDIQAIFENELKRHLGEIEWEAIQPYIKNPKRKIKEIHLNAIEKYNEIIKAIDYITAFIQLCRHYKEKKQFTSPEELMKETIRGILS